MVVEVVNDPAKTPNKNMFVLSINHTSLNLKNKIKNFKTMSKPQIIKKLAQLAKLLDQIAEAQAINSDDPETWDSDTLYDLVENLKKALQLLVDKKSKQLDDWGEPLILEEGLCSLVDEYHEKKENE